MAPPDGVVPWYKKWVVWAIIIEAALIVVLIVWNFKQQTRISHAYTNHRKLYDSYAHYYWCDEPTHTDAEKCARLGTHISPPDPPPPPD